MSEEMMVRYCSPTLAGMKTGNMFSCYFRTKETMHTGLRYFNRIFSGKGLRVIPLRYRGGRALVYVYRPAKLSRDLQDDVAGRLLRERGYSVQTANGCILRLMERMSESKEFPHEVGLFLGYPPEDVQGFIENREDPKCVGQWKVYGDAEQAQKLFAKYKKCTDVYCEQLRKGRSIQRLAVAG